MKTDIAIARQNAVQISNEVRALSAPRITARDIWLDDDNPRQLRTSKYDILSMHAPNGPSTNRL
ncbi:MAG: hypothetical protein GY770_31400 [Aestuariibacter sp.]|nr:hypothetical protein [Aestuariibacter sp.]